MSTLLASSAARKTSIICAAVGAILAGWVAITPATEVHVELWVAQPDSFKVYYDTGVGFGESKSVETSVTGVGSWTAIALHVPDWPLRALRLDLGTQPGTVLIRNLRVVRGTEGLSGSAADVLAWLTPLNDIDTIELRADEVLAITTRGNDPYLLINAPLERLPTRVFGARQLVQILGGAALGALIALLWLRRERLLGLVAHEGQIDAGFRYVPLAFVFTLGLIIAMAARSKLNSHPDEFVHFECAKFYSKYYLPPQIGDPRTVSTYSIYGSSNIDDYHVAYPLIGLAMRPLRALITNDVLRARVFQIALWCLLGGIAVVWRHQRSLLSLVLISPQVWYIFSYVNNDATALLLTVLLALQLATRDSRLNRWLDTGHGGARTAAVAGLVTGALALSKTNYLAFLAFALCHCAWRVVFDPTVLRWPYVRRVAAIAAIALSVVATRWLADVAINGWDTDAQRRAVAERVAGAGYRPSEMDGPAGMPGINLRGKGVAFADLFGRRWQFHKTTFRSLVGAYQYMQDWSPNWYYALMKGGYLALLAYLIWCIARHGTVAEKILLAGALASGTLMFGAVAYHAWTSDFQPQGRYLFPILGIGIMTLGSLRRLFDHRVIAVLAACLFLLASTSFVGTGLAHMQP